MSQEDGHLPRVGASPPLSLCPHPACFYKEQFPLPAPETVGCGSCDLAHQPHTGRKCTTGVPGIPPFQCVQVPNLPYCLTQLPLTLIQVWPTTSYLSTPPLARSASLHSLGILCTLCSLSGLCSLKFAQWAGHPWPIVYPGACKYSAHQQLDFAHLSNHFSEQGQSASPRTRMSCPQHRS